MAILVTVWGVRLSANFAVKGGFSGGEDYRWKEVRSWFPGMKYEVFNLVFGKPLAFKRSLVGSR